MKYDDPNLNFHTHKNSLQSGHLKKQMARGRTQTYNERICISKQNLPVQKWNTHLQLHALNLNIDSYGSASRLQSKIITSSRLKYEARKANSLDGAG